MRNLSFLALVVVALAGCTAATEPATHPSPSDLAVLPEEALAAGIAENIARAEAMEPVVLSDYASEAEAAAAVTAGIFECVQLGNVSLSEEMVIALTSELTADAIPGKLQAGTVFDLCIENYIDPTSPDNIPVLNTLREINANTVAAEFVGNDVTVTLGETETNTGPNNTIETYTPFHREVENHPESTEDAYINSLLAVQDGGVLRAVAPGSSYEN